MIKAAILLPLLLSSCTYFAAIFYNPEGIDPVRISDPVEYDSDDPAIWINSGDPAASLVIGTDKGTPGALYVFDLDGNSMPLKKVEGLFGPNNVDVEYGIQLGAGTVDIAVTAERSAFRLRVFSVPDMLPVDGGGIPVFEGEANRQCMGVGLYRRPSDGEVFAVVSRREGPSGAYLWQYRLYDDGTGKIVGEHVRSFGKFGGVKQIEAVAVDDENGYVYYSDEGAGIRKYHADPDHPDAALELALFGVSDFYEEREGISIYDTGGGSGYIIVSDQYADRMNIYPREGAPGAPHTHELLKRVYLRADHSDGNEVTSVLLSPLYPGGLFVAMSEGRVFHFYAWKDLAQAPGERLVVVGE